MLNAFRHQRFFHAFEFIFPYDPPLICAQRLSASKVLSLERIGARNLSYGVVLNAFRHQRFFHAVFDVVVDNEVLLCSTPFGIKGSFTVKKEGSFDYCLLVLNAFRHQRFFHELVVTIMNGVQDGAQRLSASKVLSRVALGPLRQRPFRLVLNAFRHQRFFHLLSVCI